MLPYNIPNRNRSAHSYSFVKTEERLRQIESLDDFVRAYPDEQFRREFFVISRHRKSIPNQKVLENK
jgi:hypothetical protein